MNIPTNLKYTANDEWIKVEGNIGTIGISDYAQEQLSDIVYVEILAGPGDELAKGDTCASLESVKAAADVYAPVSGRVIEFNESLPDTPELVNSSPYEGAWMLKFEISDLAELDELMDSAAYEAHLASKAH